MAYIKKEPIVDFITKGLNNPDKTKAYGYDAIEILTEIEYAPTADVEEVRHGGWLEQNLCGKTIYVCSNCQTLGSPLWKRCPICEVKMDGGKNE